MINLLSLEFLLRSILYFEVGPQDPDLDLRALSIGDLVKITPLTRPGHLSDVIREVNELAISKKCMLTIDAAVTAIRHSIAHGRVVAYSPGGLDILFKFDRKQRDGFVAVERIAPLSKAWFTDAINKVRAEIDKASSLAEELGINKIGRPVWL